MKIEIHAKQPGLGMEARVTQMDASFLKNDEQSLDAYETLLLDVIEGDRSLFIRFDEVEMAWQIIEPILKHWKEKTTTIAIPTYPAGSWGPKEANQWFSNQNQNWRNTL